ncbi:hypothetical protein TSAR_005931 [Trichomalopsis sarcophagae]|uniref:Transposase Tc1-like domain-containing protein n=1 Tax=Trichomalopsis sarcophagae TaxID=543379 RepID=A0A232FD99_9HYME|nr:hypothetical protein TSAR_005931 [Trichomalopsis sarcophagae]
MAFRPNEAHLAVMRALWQEDMGDEDHNGPVAVDGRVNNRGVQKLTEENLNAVIKVLTNDPFQAVKRLPQRLNLNVTEQTIRTNLKKRLNIKYCKAASKIQLQYANRNQRLQYALQFQIGTEEQW